MRWNSLLFSLFNLQPYENFFINTPNEHVARLSYTLLEDLFPRYLAMMKFKGSIYLRSFSMDYWLFFKITKSRKQAIEFFYMILSRGNLINMENDKYKEGPYDRKWLAELEVEAQVMSFCEVANRFLAVASSDFAWAYSFLKMHFYFSILHLLRIIRRSEVWYTVSSWSSSFLETFHRSLIICDVAIHGKIWPQVWELHVSRLFWYDMFSWCYKYQ